MQAQDLPLWILRVFALAWGAVWGSFANVVIYRWPRELSVLRPGSRCPSCETPIKPYDNVPVLGWLWLRGRCRSCKAAISARYPLVEAVYALAALGLADRAWRADPSQPASLALAVSLVHFAFAWTLLTASFIDLETLLIPDVLSLPGIALGLAVSVWLPAAGVPWRVALQGALLGAALPVLFHYGWKLLRKREGMGLGDAKLLAMIGALEGPSGVLFALSFGALQGLGAVLLSQVTGWRLGPEPEEAPAESPAESPEPGSLQAEIPFGPFLGLAALEYLFGGDRLVEAWLALLRGE
ncbi:MAG: prepilin peptidase [Deltaproteobacteria bacterium]|nr:prepilin peptidase [Deltaproteobacteria bacterium]